MSHAVTPKELGVGCREVGAGRQEGREDKTGKSLLAIQFTSPVSCLSVCLLKGKSDFYTKEEMIFFCIWFVYII